MELPSSEIAHNGLTPQEAQDTDALLATDPLHYPWVVGVTCNGVEGL